MNRLSRRELSAAIAAYAIVYVPFVLLLIVLTTPDAQWNVIVEVLRGVTRG